MKTEVRTIQSDMDRREIAHIIIGSCQLRPVNEIGMYISIIWQD